MNPNAKFTAVFTVSLILSFALGGTLGYFAPNHRAPSGKHMRGPGGKDMKEKMLKKMSAELNLSEDQKSRVRAIFEANEPKMRALHDEVRPKFEAIRSGAREEIRKILNADQIVKFEALNKRMDERMERRGLRLPPPPPAG